MTAPTTDNRPTDTIRDAFEAMIAFLTILIGGPMPRAWPEIAAVAARAIDSWARTAEGADRAVAAIAALRDLIQRAAEEHNRRAAVGGDFTPERIREARERCAEATPGPWVHSPPGVDEPHVSTKIGSDGDRVDWLASPRSAPSKRWHDAAFIAHAREDLPAALAEIERLNRLVVATANADPSWVERCTTQAAEIERLATALQAERAAWQEASGADSPGHLTAALKARRARLTAELAARAPADHLECPYCHAEIESTAGDAERVRCPECGQFSGVLVESGKRYLAGFDDAADRPPAPADASLEARAEALGRIVRAAWVEVAKKEAKTVPGYVDLWEWLEIPDADTDREIGEQVVRAVDASRPAAPEVDDDEPLPRGARVRTVAHLTALFSPSLHPHRRADATGKIVRRMTSGDIYYDVRHDDGTVAGYERSELIDLSADASRPGLTEEQAELHRAASAVIDAVIDEPLYELPIFQALAAALLRASRGETGPAPTGLTSAMHAAQQRPSEPPDPLALDPEDGTLCADCKTPRNAIHGALCSVRAGAKPGRVPDPRVTLRASDPASPFAPGSLAAGSATEDRILDRKRGGK